MVNEHSEVQQVATSYFQKLFSASISSTDLSNTNLDWINVVSHEQSGQLMKYVEDEEILITLKLMKQNKSLGPDGFNVNFFLHAWDVIGEDFIKVVKNFFVTICILRETNATALVLVPKGPNPTSMNEYRPISCCNTTYKCISKIITTSLKPIFPSLIFNAQSAFV